MDAGQHRQHEASVHALGNPLRLVEGARLMRAGVLPLESVAIPPALQTRFGLSREGAGQLVSDRPDGAGERAGDRWLLRALRLGGGAARARAMVPEDHRLCRPPRRRTGQARALAGKSEADAKELDRTLTWRGCRFSGAVAPPLHSHLHHATG